MQGKVDEKRLKRVVLGEWEEYVGWLKRVEEGPEGRVAIFDDAAVVLSGELGDLQRHIGKRVGILRTDEAERPMRMRVILDS